MAVEQNLNKMDDFGEITAIDFVNKFSTSIYDLLQILGVTRQEKLSRDLKIQTYKWDTQLDNTETPEGEIIPLSKVVRTHADDHQVKWFKKRRSVSAEAIARHGRDVAVVQADKQLMNALQYEFENQFFNFLKTKPTKVNGEGLQQALANAWGKLTTFNEFRGAELVYFINPLDVSEFLGATPVQADATNVFGMTLMKNFLGVQNVAMLNSIPKGKVYATAVDNLVFAYLDVNTSEVAGTFAEFTDNLGFIGASRDVVHQRLTLDSVFFGANTLFAEVPEGVVEATIKEPSTPAESEAGA